MKLERLNDQEANVQLSLSRPWPCFLPSKFVPMLIQHCSIDILQPRISVPAPTSINFGRSKDLLILILIYRSQHRLSCLSTLFLCPCFCRNVYNPGPNIYISSHKAYYINDGSHIDNSLWFMSVFQNSMTSRQRYGPWVKLSNPRGYTKPRNCSVLPILIPTCWIGLLSIFCSSKFNNLILPSLCSRRNND